MTKKQIADVVERVVWTFVQAFLAIWLAPVLADSLNGAADTTSVWRHVVDTSVLQKAAIGGLAAAISFIKSIGAMRFGSLGTAATLPAKLDITTPNTTTAP